MLTNPEEIAIIANARQVNIRDPSRSREHFENIFADFFSNVSFSGAKVLDLGPGQYDFGEMARERGADPSAIDNDPAVIQLGRFKGHQVLDGNLKDLNVDWFGHTFDGIFCRGSINAFWFQSDEGKLKAHIDQLVALMSPNGWAWIAPWNGVQKNSDLSAEDVERVLSCQREAFNAHGFSYHDLTIGETNRYGVYGTTANRALFTKLVHL